MDEVWAGDVLLAFDGRVLEVFGFPGQEDDWPQVGPFVDRVLNAMPSE